MSSIRYGAISLTQWKELQQLLKQKLGIELEPNVCQGQVKTHGFVFDWQYDEPAQALSLNCVKKPMLLPFALIKYQLDNVMSKLN